MKLSRIAVGSAVTLSLVGGALLASPEASAQCVTGYDDKGKEVVAPVTVSISGGTVTNETSIGISADAGTAISDASGGNNNLASTGGGGSAGTVVVSSGNGGVATSAADGGAIGMGNINSGGNVGNAVSVGDTSCAPYTPPAPEKPKDGPKDAPKDEPRGGGEVVALPDTGVGLGDASALFALIASVGAAASSLGLRRR